MKRKICCAGRPVTAIVLAGGSSRRMKAEKAGLPIPGAGTLIGHVLEQILPLFDEVLVSLSAGQGVDLGKQTGSEGVRVVRDEAPGLGPMAGILAGLTAARNEACMVIACDIPNVHVPFLRKVVRAGANAEIAVPVTAAGQFEPLFAVYTKAVIPKVESLLASGERSLLPLFPKCRTVTVPLGNSAWLLNLNTRADYERYLASRGRTKSSR